MAMIMKIKTSMRYHFSFPGMAIINITRYDQSSRARGERETLCTLGEHINYQSLQWDNDLIQIPYEYTGEVRNRSKGPDLIDRETDELRTEVRDIVRETGTKTIPMEKKCKKAKWLSEEALPYK